jgi:SAM-dependent methyltransferase
MERVRRRFAPLFSWPIGYVPERVKVSRSFDHISVRAAKRAYPIRVVRYWMTTELLRGELGKLKAAGVEKPRIVEMGCSRGHVKRFAGEVAEAGDWVGMDFNASCEEEALRTGFSKFIVADFDKKLPLEDGSADIVLCVHVMEHLERPEFTAGEIFRVLKPGGLLVAGSPVLPWPLAGFRDNSFKKGILAGKIKRGQHIQALSRSRWKGILRGAGLEPEFMNGAFLIRSSGNPLEDYRLWFRFNVGWGALFPQLGNEIYLTARKPDPLAQSR